MQKFLVMMMAFVLTIGAQAQQDDGMDAMLAAMIAAKIHQDSIDTSSLVAVYDYECQTQDADGQAVTDRMKVCVQVGQHSTRSYPYRKFREDTEGYDYFTPEELPLLRAESFCFIPEVWTNYPDGKVTVRDAIVPTPYETCEERLHIASPIYYETNAITVKTTEAKLIKMRIKTFGNRLYLKNPKYYVGDLSTADVTHDTEGILVNNVYVNNKAHVYQPLEE